LDFEEQNASKEDKNRDAEDEFLEEFLKLAQEPKGDRSEATEKFKVSLIIDYKEDKYKKDRLLSHFKRNLRSLGDVEIVGPANAEYKIDIMPLFSGNLIVASFTVTDLPRWDGATIIKAQGVAFEYTIPKIAERMVTGIDVNLFEDLRAK